MSQLVSIWNQEQLTGATPPPSFNIPNTTGAQTLKINNQSRYWLILSLANSGQDVDMIEPYSYLIIPYQSDLALRVDSIGVSTLEGDQQFVNYSTMSGAVAYEKGSTQFSGAQNVNVQGDVNIGNSTLDVVISGTPTFNLAAGQTISIANSYLDVQIQGTPTFNLAAGAKVDVTGSTIAATISGNPTFTVGNSSLNVEVLGTPTFNVGNSYLDVQISGTPTFNLAAGTQVTIANSTLDVAITGTPTFNLAAGTSVTVANSTLDVSIAGTPTFNLASGNTVNVANYTDAQGATIPLTVGGDVNASITNSTIDVSGSAITATISGTPTFNVGNSSLNVAIQGTPTFNIAAGSSVTVANSSLNVAIQGTPTMNIAAGNTVNVGNIVNAQGATVPLTVGGNVTANISNSTLNVSGSTVTATISGTPTFNIAAGNTVNIGNTVNVSGTITANIAANQSINVSNSNLNVTATISGTPSFTVANSSLNVAITGTPTFNIAAGSSVTVANSSLNVAIQGTPTFNIGAGNTVNIGNTVNVSGSTVTATISGTPTFNLSAGNSISINGVAETVINNEVLPTTQIYSGSVSVTNNFTTNATATANVTILPDGDFVEIHRGIIYLKSTAGCAYDLTGVDTYATFKDGTNYWTGDQWVIDNTTSTFAGANAIANSITFSLQLSPNSANPATTDTVTIYYVVDTGDVAIETPNTEGVPIMASSSYLQDASGSMTTGGTAQNIYTQPGYHDLQYLFIQNLSSEDMYISFGDMNSPTTGVNVPTIGGAGTIWIPANGGSITFESSFVPNDSLNIISATTGSKYTVKYAIKGGGNMSANKG